MASTTPLDTPVVNNAVLSAHLRFRGWPLVFGDGLLVEVADHIDPGIGARRKRLSRALAFRSWLQVVTVWTVGARLAVYGTSSCASTVTMNLGVASGRLVNNIALTNKRHDWDPSPVSLREDVLWLPSCTRLAPSIAINSSLSLQLLITLLKPPGQPWLEHQVGLPGLGPCRPVHGGQINNDGDKARRSLPRFVFPLVLMNPDGLHMIEAVKDQKKMRCSAWLEPPGCGSYATTPQGLWRCC